MKKSNLFFLNEKENYVGLYQGCRFTNAIDFATIDCDDEGQNPLYNGY